MRAVETRSDPVWPCFSIAARVTATRFVPPAFNSPDLYTCRFTTIVGTFSLAVKNDPALLEPIEDEEAEDPD